jgi:hypothetical protein
MENYTINSYTDAPITVSIDNSLELFASAVLLKVDFRLWGDSCKADTGDMQIDANKRLLSLQKKLIECKEYEAIKALTKRIGKRILQIGLPASKSFRAGFYRVPSEFVPQMEEMLLGAYREFLSTVRGFLFEYRDAQMRASRSSEEGGLGILYRSSDYPSLEELETKFSFSWQFISLSVPQNLPVEIEQRERETFRKGLLAAREECVEALRVGFSALVDRATERLRENPEGKRLRFQESLTSQMTEFIDSFSVRNSIANDEALAILVEKARRIMADCPNLTDLKDDAAMRQQIQARFAEIQENITAANLVPRKGRAMSIDEN